MKKISKTQYAILGMLSIEPMSGYEIRQLMQKSTENFWSESDGQLYPALALLNKNGLITAKATETSSAREKKIYRLSNKGRAELKKWLHQEAETHSIRNEFMLKLFFGANVDSNINLEHVQAQRYETNAKLLRFEEAKKRMVKSDKESLHFPYWLMSLEFGIKATKAKLEWCDEVIRSLQKLK